MLKAVKNGFGVGARAWVQVPVLIGVLLLAGCEKPKPPAPPPPPPPPPKAPPPPEAITVSKVLSDLKPDPRVQFPQEVAPVDETLAIAVVNLANSLAKADSTALRDMLSGDAQVTLDGLVNSGEWDDATSKIEGVRVLRIRDNASTGTQSMTDATVWLAIQEPGSAYVMGWNAVSSNGKWKFDGAAATNAVRARAADFEGMGESELIAMVSAASSTTASAAPSPSDPMAAIAAGNFAAIASLPEEQLIVLYISNEVLKRLGMPVPPYPAEMQAAMDKGKAALAAGKKPDPAALSGALKGFEMLGKSRDEIATALAAVMNIDKAAAEAMLGGSAPKPAVPSGG